MDALKEFFSRLPSGSETEFIRYSLTHYLVLLFSIVIIYLFFKVAPYIKKSPHEKKIRYTLGLLMILTNVSLWGYSFNEGKEWYHYLPIATCGWAVYSGGLALLTKNQVLFKLTLFWGFGAVLTLLGSNLLEGPDRYNFYQYFFRHIGILISAFYLMQVFDYKITKKDYKLFFIVTMAFTIAATVINLIVNKPDELNMFYTMQPAVKGTPLTWFHDISRYLYIAIWIPIAALLGYLYGLIFFQKEED